MVPFRAAVMSCCLSAFASPLVSQVITEVMYHPREENPPGTEDKRHEWIEIYNENADPADLSGYRFTRGISFTFPMGTYLLGRSYLVVCANESLVQAKYGIDNTIGNWDPTTSLDNGGEKITLANSAGVVISTVEYNDRGRWPAAADGTGHSLAIRSPYLQEDDPDNWAPSADLEGTPGGPNFESNSSFKDTVLIADNEIWDFFKGTAAPPANWNQVGFTPPAGWLTGATGIGYGDNDDRTSIPDMMNSYWTIFCRKQFTVADPAKVQSLILTVAYDDGFYAYLNGTDVAAVNVSSKAFNAAATSSIEPTTVELDLTSFKGLLTPGGNNVLAVQVHNSTLASSDLSFIPKLVSREPLLTVPPVILNEGLLRTAGDRWVELYNPTAAEIDLAGYHLTDDRRSLSKSTLPSPTAIPPHGWRAFTDAELGLNFSLSSPLARDQVFVALVNPAGTRVVDSYLFKPTVDEKSEARFPDGDRDMAPAARPTLAAANDVPVAGGRSVVINEIMYHPISEDPNHEYIELYNRGSAPVSLLGFRLDRAVEFAFPDVTIGPDQYLVVASDPLWVIDHYGLPVDQVLGPWYHLGKDAQGNPIQEGATLADAGERITLLDPDGNVADSVHFADSGAWPLWADGGGSSLELIDPASIHDAGAAWDASDDSAKSSPQEYTYTAKHNGGESELQLLLLDRGIAVVDQISVRSGAVEHVGNGDFEADGSGWVYQGTQVNSGFTDDPDLVIDGSGSLKIVASSGGDNKVNRIESRPDLSPALVAGTAYTVSFTARWIVGSRSLLTQGYNHGLSRSHLLGVPERLGTPGGQNSVTARRIALTGSANLGPVIDQVSHQPVVPGAGESVTVAARVRDNDGIRSGSVSLHYALNTPPAQLAGFTAIAMADPDGDGKYQASIPGQPLGTRVIFFITAEDGSSAHVEGRFPIDHLQRTHPLIRDGASATLNDLHYAIYRHDTRNPSTPYHNYRFVTHQANQDYLFNRPVHSNDLIDGTFVFGADRAYYGASIRWSGSPWLRGRTWGNSYRVRFPSDNLLHGRIRGFNLENHSTDGRERISHYLLRYQNVPGVKVPHTRQWYARWQVNDQVNSVYEHVPQPDNDYISAWWPDEADGDFFEMDDRFEFNDNGDRISNQDGRLTWPPYANGTYPTPDPAQSYASWRENYRYYLNPRAKTGDDDWTNLMGLSKLLDPGQTTNAAFDAAVWSHVDVEEFLRVWAVRMNTDDWDSWGTSRGKNCYVYQRSSTGLWVLIPWDLELTYGSTTSFPLPANASSPISINALFPEITRMINRPHVRRRYYGILKEMVDRQFNSDFLSPWMDLLAQNGTGSTEVGGPGGYIDQRADLIRGWIRATVFPQQRLAITTNAGKAFSTQTPVVDLAGDAPVEISAIVAARDGAPIDPQPALAFSELNLKGFTLRGIQLVPGLNRIQLLGYDSSENLVDSTTIDITQTGAWNAPAISAITPEGGMGGSTLQVAGSDFHSGIRVFFGASESLSVTFNEGTDPTHLAATVPASLAPGSVAVKVRNLDLQESGTKTFTVLARFIRGDADLGGSIDIADAVRILFVLFEGASAPCLDALDTDDSGVLDLTDATRLLDFLFRGGPAPAPPYPTPGSDPTFSSSPGCAQGL